MDAVDKKILLVEDNRIAQVAAEALLRQSGYLVDIASNGDSAFSLASHHHYSLILMDINLGNGETDGFDVTQRIRQLQNYQETYIIALTAHNDDRYQEQAMAAGMNAYITKPLTISSLKALFQQYPLSTAANGKDQPVA